MPSPLLAAKLVSLVIVIDVSELEAATERVVEAEFPIAYLSAGAAIKNAGL
jgi:hypothetical protein